MRKRTKPAGGEAISVFRPSGLEKPGEREVTQPALRSFISRSSDLRLFSLSQSVSSGFVSFCFSFPGGKSRTDSRRRWRWCVVAHDCQAPVGMLAPFPTPVLSHGPLKFLCGGFGMSWGLTRGRHHQPLIAEALTRQHRESCRRAHRSGHIDSVAMTQPGSARE